MAARTRRAGFARVMIQRELNRACEGWGLLIKVLALIVGLILGVSFVVASSAAECSASSSPWSSAVVASSGSFTQLAVK